MGVLYTPESAEGKELWKWDHSDSEVNPVNGERGMRPSARKEFPKRLYRAGRNGQGVPTIVEGVTVDTEHEEANYQSRGFREGQDKALALLHASDAEIAELAANRAYTDRKMSAKAQDEARQADESTSAHLPTIPDLPIKRRPGRPSKGGD